VNALRRIPARLWVGAGVLAAVVLLAALANVLAARSTASAPSSGPAASPVPSVSPDSPRPTRISPAPTTAAPAAPATAVPGDDDTPVDPVQPSVPDPGAPAREAASAFAAAWLNTINGPDQWRAGLHPRVTAELWALLADADLETVPVGRVGTPITVTRTGDVLDATIPVVSSQGAPVGVLTLTLQADSLLVGDIDWEPVR
jgi:hypothetical protein